jgi:lipoyl(octanoyl) transferase
LEKQRVFVDNLGLIGYEDAWSFQERLLENNVRLKIAAALEKKEAADTTHHLLFCEHPPVYTLGKSGKISHLLIGEEELRRRAIGFVHTNRGGDITFHGPGQLVMYPILDLEKFTTDIGLYLRNLEEAVIRCLDRFGIVAGRSAGETGVWLDAGVPGRARKICAMGVRCSRWITMHGIALNVNTDLSYFQNIIPCGIADKEVASMQVELNHPIDLQDVQRELGRSFTEIFGCELALTPRVSDIT